MRRTLLLPPLLLIAALLVACDDGGEAPAPSPSATAPSATATAGETPVGTGTPAFDGTLGPLDIPLEAPGTALIVDVRTGRHDEGFDRVTFEFENYLPGFRVAYEQPPIIADPTGLPIDVEGAAFLRVTLSPASGIDLSGETPRRTCCRSEITTGFPALVDLQPAGDFEAVTSYVLGLSQMLEFRVTRLLDPPRLAIDVRHPE